MNTFLAFGIVGTICSIFSSWIYIISILKGKTIPSRATWIIGTISSAILFFSYYAEGARATLGIPLNIFITSTIVLILSIKRGHEGWSHFDKMCFFVVLLSLLFWYLFNSPFIALIINLIIDIVSTIPTVRKLFYLPHSEDLAAWGVAVIGNLLNILAVEQLRFGILVYPIVTFSINLIVTIIIIYNKRKFAIKNF